MEVKKLVAGKVTRIVGDEVLIEVDAQYKGVVPLAEWYDETAGEIVPPHPGDVVVVLLEVVEGECGNVVLSYLKARPCWSPGESLWWRQVQEGRIKQGDCVRGSIMRRIEEGLVVEIGVRALLPVSEAGTRMLDDFEELRDRTLEFEILSIDRLFHRVVLSCRNLIENRCPERTKDLLAAIVPGQIRTGVVQEITRFGAFIDLGGIEGQLRTGDLSWSRVNTPWEVVPNQQKLEVYILSVDRARGKIGVGLKQKTPNPWPDIGARYAVGSRHTGEVVNVTHSGAFVRLKPGIEGLVPVTEMSWIQRINPRELVSIGDQIAVQVLGINQERQEISLGMKQLRPNPWDRVSERYPPGTVITGVVCKLTRYGALVEMEEDVHGLLHVRDMSGVRKVTDPGEVVSEGGSLTCVVLQVNEERQRIALGLK
jgi:small subunit ribosomal protein S1